METQRRRTRDSSGVRWAYLLAVVAIRVSAPSHIRAQQPEYIKPIGTTAFELASSSTNANVTVAIPVRTPGHAQQALTATVSEVLVGGVSRPLDRTKFSFAMDTNAGRDVRFLTATVTAAALRPGDLYDVRLVVTAAGLGPMQALSFTVTVTAVQFDFTVDQQPGPVQRLLERLRPTKKL